MTYDITYDAQARQYLKSLDRHIQKRLLEKIRNSLAATPVPRSAKSVINEHGVFRLRIGKYRVLYRVNHRGGSVVIFKLDKRSRVYK